MTDSKTASMRIKINPKTHCWEWLGRKDRQGYGRFNANGKCHSAHRSSYELFIGRIDKGLEIDHLCRVTGCINPEHLEAVTKKENTLRGISFAAINSRKTKCPKGHPLSGDNLKFRTYGRECKTCHKRGNDLRPRKGLFKWKKNA